MQNASKKEAAFDEAFRAHSDSLFRHAQFRVSNRERALEITQDAFLKTWDYIQGGGEVQSYKSFLFRTLNNLIIDEYRKHKSHSLDEILENDTGDMELRLSDGSVRETEEQLDEQELFSRIRTHISTLPDAYRTAVTLRFIDGFSPKEIATMIGETENVVSVRIHRGIQKLKTLCAHVPL